METTSIKVNKSRSDWCKVLSLYSEQQSICSRCAIQKDVLQSFLLPINLAEKKLKDIQLKPFAIKLISINKPIIFVGNKIQDFTTFLIQYQGNEDYPPLLTTLQEYLNPDEKPSALIISPNHIKKSNKLAEANMVKVLQSVFKPTSFIKLPLEKLSDLLAYAEEQKVHMLLLPFNMLEAYLKLMTGANTKDIIPAAFVPNRLI